MKERNPIVILAVSMLAAIFFVSLSSMGAENTSSSQTDLGGQSAGMLATAPHNPEWIEYEQNLTEGKAIEMVTPSGNALGHIPGPVDFSYLVGKRAMGVAGTYPESYDLRTIGKVTSVKDQSQYGTCWAFATFGSLESYLLPYEERDFSEYNLATRSGFDIPWYDGGQRLMSTAYLSRWCGPVDEVDDPYPEDDDSSETDDANTAQKHTQNVYFLPGRASSTDNDNIKWALMTYGGLDVAFYWSSACYSSNPATYYYPFGTNTNHEVTLVGWDDNYAASNFRGTAGAPPGNGAFILKNSWGTSWGDGGYFYLSYYDTSLRAVTAYTAEPVCNYAAEYQYDPLGWVTSLGYGDTTAWGANVFTADSSSNPLTAVSFYTNDVNTQYEVYIYTDPTSGPVGGTRYVGPNGVMPLAGYHTVKLASPVPLDAGQRFSVVVKFNTSGYTYPLASEYAISGYSSGADASLGQSYCSYDGSDWLDVVTYESTMNICIKAFTSGCPASPIWKSGGSSPWMALDPNAIYLDVDTSAAGFTEMPRYFASLGGSANSWDALGVSAIYSATPKGFRVNLMSASGIALTPAYASSRGWYVQWLGVPTTNVNAGCTPSGTTDWKAYGSKAIYLDVDTSGAGFTETPRYFTTLGGSANNWDALGVNAIYSATPNGFRIYLKSASGIALTPAYANSKGWYVLWLGVPADNTDSGATPSGTTDWKAYGSKAIYLDVDTSGAGFTETPRYFTTLGGSANNWDALGVNAIYSATPNGFRIYLKSASGIALTPAYANSKGWYVQWLGV